MSIDIGWLRPHAARLVAIVCIAVTFTAARLPGVGSADRAELAARFKLTAVSIAQPTGYPMHTIRQVNPEYRRIQAWISSVGAGIAMADLDSDGRPNDLCFVDTRIDQA